MPLISANLDEETYKLGKISGIKWGNLIKRGLKTEKSDIELAQMKENFEELQRDFDKQKAHSTSRGLKLQAYIEKYGLDDEIMYKRGDLNAMVQEKRTDTARTSGNY